MSGESETHDDQPLIFYCPIGVVVHRSILLPTLQLHGFLALEDLSMQLHPQVW
jgi:hypothetical protein